MRSVRRLKTSIVRNTATKQPRVKRAAIEEKVKAKLVTVSLNSAAVMKTSSCESSTPAASPTTNDATDARKVSSTRTRDTWERVMPSNW